MPAATAHDLYWRHRINVRLTITYGSSNLILVKSVLIIKYFIVAVSGPDWKQQWLLHMPFVFIARTMHADVRVIVLANLSDCLSVCPSNCV